MEKLLIQYYRNTWFYGFITHSKSLFVRSQSCGDRGFCKNIYSTGYIYISIVKAYISIVIGISIYVVFKSTKWTKRKHYFLTQCCTSTYKYTNNENLTSLIVSIRKLKYASNHIKLKSFTKTLSINDEEWKYLPIFWTQLEISFSNLFRLSIKTNTPWSHFQIRQILHTLISLFSSSLMVSLIRWKLSLVEFKHLSTYKDVKFEIGKVFTE